MASPNGEVERRIGHLEKVYVDDRERWRKSEELWAKNDRRLARK